MTDATVGREVRGGWYVDTSRWSVRAVPRDGGRLPAGEWRRVPGWAVLPAAPIVGGFFVIGLPLYGAAVLVHAIASRALRGAGRAARSVAAAVAPEPSPGEAHLSGPAGGAPVKPGEQPGLDEVEARIKARQAEDAAPEEDEPPEE
ncbi:MAG TPA: hypothetical protein VFP50_02510 [Anaeromyxobacteraceae bacterium]|nr:hypothetical protein [Anaeromyxobacteraceae bacterium]